MFFFFLNKFIKTDGKETFIDPTLYYLFLITKNDSSIVVSIQTTIYF